MTNYNFCSERTENLFRLNFVSSPFLRQFIFSLSHVFFSHQKDFIWAARFGHFHRYCQMQINQDHHRKAISMARCLRFFHHIHHRIISTLFIRIMPTTITQTTITMLLAVAAAAAGMREISIAIRMFNLPEKKTRNSKSPLASIGEKIVYWKVLEGNTVA